MRGTAPPTRAHHSASAHRAPTGLPGRGGSQRGDPRDHPQHGGGALAQLADQSADGPARPVFRAGPGSGARPGTRSGPGPGTRARARGARRGCACRVGCRYPAQRRLVEVAGRLFGIAGPPGVVRVAHSAVAFLSASSRRGALPLSGTGMASSVLSVVSPVSRPAVRSITRALVGSSTPTSRGAGSSRGLSFGEAGRGRNRSRRAYVAGHARSCRLGGHSLLPRPAQWTHAQPRHSGWGGDWTLKYFRCIRATTPVERATSGSTRPGWASSDPCPA